MLGQILAPLTNCILFEIAIRQKDWVSVDASGDKVENLEATVAQLSADLARVLER